ncbi:MAG: FemAB family PEP-CTERM system-associated protein [Acidobacteria bacterium]|nr:MAG: FemAB family PEP-CTERM system-associated protein [Acidobacteriota bacterium]
MHAEVTLERAVRVAGSVSVRAYEAHESEKWEGFVARCRDATFFHRIGWREIIEEIFGHRCHYLVAERDGRWSGVMPLAVIRSRLFGHALVSLPFAVYGGPAADDTESAGALISAADNLARTLGVDYLEVRNTQSRCSEWPRQDLYVTFRKDISPDVEANMLAIPRKQRAMVRKGIKNGLVSEIDMSANRFFALYADNVHRHGTPPFPRRYFARLMKVFGDACEVQTIVDAKGHPISTVMSFYFRDEVLPYYAGDTASARDLAANDFKYWELLRRACERGVRVFDYGRSKRGTGSYDFKKNWGFEATPLAYEYQLLKRARVPENNPLNPKYASFIAIWRRLPRPVANALGPMIVRNLG